MKYFGVYFVDATDLGDWTDETLAEALEIPLSKIGIGVEIGQHITGIVFFDDVGYDKSDSLREQIRFIVESIVTEGPLHNEEV